MNQNTLCLIALFALVAALVLPVSAQNMTITNFGFSGKQDLMVYTANGTLLGQYNTSSPYIPLPSQDFQVVVRPNTQNGYVSNPMLFFSDATTVLLANIVPIFMIMGMIAMAIGLAKMGRRR